MSTGIWPLWSPSSQGWRKGWWVLGIAKASALSIGLGGEESMRLSLLLSVSSQASVTEGDKHSPEQCR